FDAVELAEPLHGALDRIGDFLGNLVGTRPRIRCDDQRLLDREFRIFETAHRDISGVPARNEQKHRDENNAVVADREFAGIHISAASEGIAQVANFHALAKERDASHRDAVARLETRGNFDVSPRYAAKLYRPARNRVLRADYPSNLFAVRFLQYS